MSLPESLDLSNNELVTFVGAGGKKTAIHKLLSSDQPGHTFPMLYTTTTKMPPPQDIPLRIRDKQQLNTQLSDWNSTIAIASGEVSDPSRVPKKFTGYSPDVIDSIFSGQERGWVLVKGDGARQREIKAPGQNEPQIPKKSTIVVPVISVQVVGSPLSKELAHRVEQIEYCTSLSRGDDIAAEDLGQLIAHKNGGCKSVPPTAEIIPMVNKADNSELEQAGKEVLLAAANRSKRISAGIICSLKNGYVSKYQQLSSSSTG